MRRTRLLRASAWALAFIAGVLLLIPAFIPNREIEAIVGRVLERGGYRLVSGEFGKGYPFGIKAKKLVLAVDKGEALRFDTVTARLSLISLLSGKPLIVFSAGIGTGELAGTMALGKTPELKLKAQAVPLEAIPFFRNVAGVEIKGKLRGEVNMKGSGGAASGEIRAEVTGADLRSVRIGEMPLPDAGYETVQGMLRVKSGRAILESLTLQGKTLYTRLKGDISVTSPLGASPLNLTLELMPKPEFLEQQKFIFLLLVKYLITPGHYQLPIRGVLGKPTL